MPSKLFNVLRWAVEMRVPKGLVLGDPELEEGRSMFRHIILEDTRLKAKVQEPGANY